MKATLKGPLLFILALVILIGGYTLLTMKDQRTPAQKADDALQEIGRGSDNAARQLEDRTLGQKLGDAVKDTGEKIKESTTP